MSTTSFFQLLFQISKCTQSRKNFIGTPLFISHKFNIHRVFFSKLTLWHPQINNCMISYNSQLFYIATFIDFLIKTLKKITHCAQFALTFLYCSLSSFTLSFSATKDMVKKRLLSGRRHHLLVLSVSFTWCHWIVHLVSVFPTNGSYKWKYKLD